MQAPRSSPGAAISGTGGRAGQAAAETGTNAGVSSAATSSTQTPGSTTGAVGTVRGFRVEGAPNTRALIADRGTVIVLENDNMLFLNFGSQSRSDRFFATRLRQGMPGVGVKSFEVPKSFVDELRASAVPEALAGQNPGKPIIVDVATPDQFGLRRGQI